MSDERRRTFDGVGGYLKVYWPLIVTMAAALGGYMKTSFLVENVVERVTALEAADKAQAVFMTNLQREGDGQKGTIMVIDERTRRMAEDIRELRNGKRDTTRETTK